MNSILFQFWRLRSYLSDKLLSLKLSPELSDSKLPVFCRIRRFDFLFSVFSMFICVWLLMFSAVQAQENNVSENVQTIKIKESEKTEELEKEEKSKKVLSTENIKKDLMTDKNLAVIYLPSFQECYLKLEQSVDDNTVKNWIQAIWKENPFCSRALDKERPMVYLLRSDGENLYPIFLFPTLDDLPEAFVDDAVSDQEDTLWKELGMTLEDGDLIGFGDTPLFQWFLGTLYGKIQNGYLVISTKEILNNLPENPWELAGIRLMEDRVAFVDFNVKNWPPKLLDGLLKIVEIASKLNEEEFMIQDFPNGSFLQKKEKETFQLLNILHQQAFTLLRRWIREIETISLSLNADAKSNLTLSFDWTAHPGSELSQTWEKINTVSSPFDGLFNNKEIYWRLQPKFMLSAEEKILVKAIYAFFTNYFEVQYFRFVSEEIENVDWGKSEYNRIVKATVNSGILDFCAVETENEQLFFGIQWKNGRELNQTIQKLESLFTSSSDSNGTISSRDTALESIEYQDFNIYRFQIEENSDWLIMYSLSFMTHSHSILNFVSDTPNQNKYDLVLAVSDDFFLSCLSSDQTKLQGIDAMKAIIDRLLKPSNLNTENQNAVNPKTESLNAESSNVKTPMNLEIAKTASKTEENTENILKITEEKTAQSDTEKKQTKNGLIYFDLAKSMSYSLNKMSEFYNDYDPQSNKMLQLLSGTLSNAVVQGNTEYGNNKMSIQFQINRDITATLIYLFYKNENYYFEDQAPGIILPEENWDDDQNHIEFDE